MALRGHHVQELTAARHEGPQGLQGRLRPRPRRGVNPFRNEREEGRIQPVGFRERSGGVGEVADLARIGPHHREFGGGQGGDQRRFVSPGRFEDDERGRHGTEALDGGDDASDLVRRGPRRAVRPAGHHEIRLGDIDTDEDGGRCHRVLHGHRDPSWPSLANAGHAPTQLFGLADETPATPRLSCGLVDRRKHRAVVGGWTSCE